jgi:hypothetical protein
MKLPMIKSTVDDTNDLKVEVSGVIAWTLLSYALIRIGQVYFSDIRIIGTVLYNIFGVIYLLFFLGFYQERLSIKKVVRLLICYNLLMIVYETLYRSVILIDADTSPGSELLIRFGVNFMISIGVYLFVQKFRKQQTV